MIIITSTEESEGEAGQSDLPANSPHKLHHKAISFQQNRLFIALLRIGRAGEKVRSARPVSSFTLHLKSQINLAIWKKEIAVEECDSPHTNRS